MDIIKMEINVKHSLRNVFQAQYGVITDVSHLETLAPMEQFKGQVVVNQQLPVKEDKIGTAHFFNVFVLKELDGMVENVSSVLEVKSGI